MRQKFAVLSSLFALIAVAVLIARQPHRTPQWITPHGFEKPPDAAVLEAVLIDLLTEPDSPVESNDWTQRSIHFSMDALLHEINPEIVPQFRDNELKNVSAKQIAMTREAAKHLTERVEKRTH